MSITRFTVLSRHTYMVAGILSNSIIKHKTIVLNDTVSLVQFYCNKYQSIFGIPYSVESISECRTKVSRVYCHVDEAGVARYIPNKVRSASNWERQENIYRSKESNHSLPKTLSANLAGKKNISLNHINQQVIEKPVSRKKPTAIAG